MHASDWFVDTIYLMMSYQLDQLHQTRPSDGFHISVFITESEN